MNHLKLIWFGVVLAFSTLVSYALFGPLVFFLLLLMGLKEFCKVVLFELWFVGQGIRDVLEFWYRLLAPSSRKNMLGMARIMRPVALAKLAWWMVYQPTQWEKPWLVTWDNAVIADAVED